MRISGGANLTATISGLTEDTDNAVDALTLGTVDVLASGDITLSATDITGNATIGAIGGAATADNVTLTYAGVTGTVNLGNVDADETINIVAGLVSAAVADTFDLGNVATVDSGSTVSIDISGVQLNNTSNAAGSDLTVGTVDADASINFNAAGVTADELSIGTLTASDVVFTAAGANLDDFDVDVTIDADTVTFTGTDNEGNVIDITADDSATIVTGAKADDITLTGDADSNAVATFTLDLVDSAANTITYDATTGDGAVRLTVDNFVVGGDVLNGEIPVGATFTATQIVEVDATANGGQNIADARDTIVSFLADAGVSATAVQITNVFSLDADALGTGQDFLFTFGGNVHVIAQDGLGAGAGDDSAAAMLTFDDNDAFITLVGVGLVQDEQTAESVFGL